MSVSAAAGHSRCMSRPAPTRTCSRRPILDSLRSRRTPTRSDLLSAAGLRGLAGSWRAPRAAQVLGWSREPYCGSLAFLFRCSRLHAGPGQTEPAGPRRQWRYRRRDRARHGSAGSQWISTRDPARCYAQSVQPLGERATALSFVVELPGPMGGGDECRLRRVGQRRAADRLQRAEPGVLEYCGVAEPDARALERYPTV